ncbi:MAG: hypothetical protein LBH19_11390 [Dysgonamonadaceae bacterium]|jgi:hypothetical protein|nr:hypothetical protein [Dysgonamonadaceae bacterium]
METHSFYVMADLIRPPLLTIKYLLTIFLSFLLCACTPKNEIQVTILNEALSTGYIGNGVEWDPYDEAEAWGSALSEADWQTLFQRLDYMRPGYVRCMINCPYRYYDWRTGNYDKNRNIESISRLLKYCTEKNITVIYGEYNPPTEAMKSDPRWVDMSVDYLNYLVNDLGFSCIRYFVIFNEPDGHWAYPNGDYELWKSMLLRFHQKMQEYSGLSEKVTFAGPDVVVKYTNPASAYNSVGWVEQTVKDVDPLIGVYDIHAYPGQAEVRKGDYAAILAEYKQAVPAGKKIVLGEAGFKYGQPADSLLMQEYNRRTENHPFTKGSDSNMLVYDYFYGLDMAQLCIEVMNSGYSGMAAWMLDDAMHSNSDSGIPKDIKLWGMWNILGEEVFNDASQEEVRPWYYTWSLMCRYFPAGSSILKTTFDRTQGVYIAAAERNGQYTVAAVNVDDSDKQLNISIPFPNQEKASLFVYEDEQAIPVQSVVEWKSAMNTKIKSQSFVLITNME